MTRTTAATVLVAAMLVLAGCAGGIGGTPGATDGTNGDGTTDDGGQVAFYVSDRPGAIDQFDHLNVTVTKVGLHRVGTAADDGANATNASAANGTAEDAEAEGDDGESDDEGEDGRWVEHTVDSRSVDLTELRGANASRLGVLNASAGEYDKVFVYVSDVNATLTDGTAANVKLPSGKLQINKGFTVGAGDRVEFVFDIMVHEAGNSGKYILRPVVAESGTSEEVEIRDVGDERSGRADDDEDDDDANETDDALAVGVAGTLEAGSNATVTVTADGAPVENATVTVDDRVVGTTDANGELTVTVPDTEELEIDVEKGDLEGELERPVTRDGNANQNGNGNANANATDDAALTA